MCYTIGGGGYGMWFLFIIIANLAIFILVFILRNIYVTKNTTFAQKITEIFFNEIGNNRFASIKKLTLANKFFNIFLFSSTCEVMVVKELWSLNTSSWNLCLSLHLYSLLICSKKSREGRNSLRLPNKVYMMEKIYRYFRWIPYR